MAGLFVLRCASRGWFLKARGGAQPFSNALGGARPRSLTRAIPVARPLGQLSAVKAASCGLYLLLAQKKRTKEKGPRRLAPRRWRGVPCASRDFRLHQRVGGALIPLRRAGLARRIVSGADRPTGCRRHDPPWCSRAPQVENGSARGLSDRAQRGSSAAPVFCRGAQGSRSAAQTKPWGALSFRLFSLGKQQIKAAGSGLNS